VALDSTAIRQALTDHALASGHFERVGKHEPKAPPPGGGLNAALWVQRVAPAVGMSGLKDTAGIVTFRLRIYQNMLYEPQDDIDPRIDRARDALMLAYSADFTLGGLIRNVVLLGPSGASLSAEAGYVPLGNTMQRVFDITIPCVVNDCWPQQP
jgi:hypothetical protein